METRALPHIRLIATDFDGTLFGMDETPADLLAFRELLKRARNEWGACWTIVTGRSRGPAESALRRLLLLGLRPDYIVLEDARIYRLAGGGRLWPFWWWNFQVTRRRRALFRRSRVQVRAWRQEVIDRCPDALDLSRPGIHLWFRCAETEKAVAVEAFLRERAAASGKFFVFRWDDEVALFPTAGSKGEALQKLAAVLGIHTADTFAVGDGPNDVSMLDGTAAGLTACVSNAVPAVRDAVRAANGQLATRPGIKGVIEVLTPFLDTPTTAD